ncbi:proliferation-associated protein 2G4-like [Copidosoma floridanum]|uniref:proliferation-associated protein 2G4-like n=1 Tax=Copidosoma floridanum TaxID=29053 RepID=UPI0006C967F8|nr:proliferation-associated protein 2G4-like [Copidosoma floridanum]
MVFACNMNFVLYEKPNEYVAQFKFTVLLMPTGPHKITGIPFEQELYDSQHTIDDPTLIALLHSSANPKSAKKKKKKSEKCLGDGSTGISQDDD